MNINATLLGQTIMFIMFVWFCMKFVWPPIMQALTARKKLIADGLAAGERGKHELELASRRATESMHEAKQKAAEVIAQAEKRAAQIIEEAKGIAKEEGDRLIAGAKAEIEQEINRAREVLAPTGGRTGRRRRGEDPAPRNRRQGSRRVADFASRTNSRGDHGMEIVTIARPYAEAVYRLASQEGALD